MNPSSLCVHQRLAQALGSNWLVKPQSWLEVKIKGLNVSESSLCLSFWFVCPTERQKGLLFGCGKINYVTVHNDKKSHCDQNCNRCFFVSFSLVQTQFVLVVIYLLNVYRSNCVGFWEHVLLVFYLIYLASLLILFGNFYIQSYLKKNQASRSSKQIKSE